MMPWMMYPQKTPTIVTMVKEQMAMRDILLYREKTENKNYAKKMEKEKK